MYNDYGTISGGTFNGAVTNNAGTISGGTFNADVTSRSYLYGEYATINGGTFNGKLTNNSIVYTANVSTGENFSLDDKGGTCIHTMSVDSASPNVIVSNACWYCNKTNKATITVPQSVYNYTGSVITPAEVTYENWTGEEPTVQYENNLNACTATAYIEVGGVKATQTFTINPASLDNAVITLEKDEFTYDGNPHKPAVTVKLANFPNLVEGTDYTVLYTQPEVFDEDTNTPKKWVESGSGCTNAGTYYVAIFGKGNFTTTNETLGIYKSFVINKADPKQYHFTFTPPRDLIYDHMEKKATVTLADYYTGMGEITVGYSAAMDGAPTNAGTYNVYITTTGGSNYNATTGGR